MVGNSKFETEIVNGTPTEIELVRFDGGDVNPYIFLQNGESCIYSIWESGTYECLQVHIGGNRVVGLRAIDKEYMCNCSTITVAFENGEYSLQRTFRSAEGGGFMSGAKSVVSNGMSKVASKLSNIRSSFNYKGHSQPPSDEESPSGDTAQRRASG